MIGFRTKFSTALSAMAVLGLSQSPVSAQDVEGLLPPNAAAGECYARVYTPSKEERVARQVLVQPEGDDLEIIPAVYRTVTKSVVVQPASEDLEIIPAVYEDQIETVVISPAKEEQVVIPAVYETVEERVLVQAETQVWKKGTGPIQRYDFATGEIMCLVTIPAQYETVEKEVLKTPARIETKVTPPQTVEITKRVMIEPPKTRKVIIPAEYETVEVEELVTPAVINKVVVPAKFETVYEVVNSGVGQMEWRPILCETNAKPDLIAEIQRALRTEGYEPGTVDGKLGAATMRAVERYQQANGLSQGNLTIETIRALGINPTG